MIFPPSPLFGCVQEEGVGSKDRVAPNCFPRANRLFAPGVREFIANSERDEVA
jgi:hypothetical protein